MNPFVDNPNLLRWLLPQSNYDVAESFCNLYAIKKKIPNNIKKDDTKKFSNSKEKCFKYLVVQQMTNKQYLTTVLFNKYKENKKPTLIIHGEDDRYVLPKSVNIVAQYFNLDVRWLKNVGHSPFVEVPNILSGIINQFVKK